MINDNDRIALIGYRLQQARETIELAKFLLNNDRLSTAVNRIYYGMYYALTALAIKHEFSTSKHLQLIGWFNKNFIATEIVNPIYGKMLRNAFQSRTKGDYDAFIEFRSEEVASMINDLEEFVKEISRLTKA